MAHLYGLTRTAKVRARLLTGLLLAVTCLAAACGPAERLNLAEAR